MRARCRNVTRSTAGFGRRHEAEQRQDRAEHPGREIERGDRQQDGAAAERLQDRPRLAALLLGQRRDPRHLARALGELEPIERGLGAGLGLHPADVADEPDEAVRLLDLDRLARGPHRDRGLGDGGAGALQRRPVDHVANRTADPVGQPRAQPPGLARRLHRRQPEPRRRRRADRGVGAGGDRDADHGETQDQLVVVLAADVAAAFAHRVADIAEHEQIAQRGAGQPGHVLRLAGDQAAGKASGGGAGGIGLFDRRLRRAVFSSGGSAAPRSAARSTKLWARSASLASSAASISWTATVPSNARAKPAVGDRHRIVGGREQRLRLEPERHAEQRRQRKQAGGEPCQSGVRANHFGLLPEIVRASGAAGQRFRFTGRSGSVGFEQSR